MNRTLIAHTADWHLRDSHLGLPSRGACFTAAAKNAVLEAIRAKAHAMVLCGDVFNSSTPSPQNLADFDDIHNMAIAAGLPILTISGNHDESSLSWQALFRKLKSDSEKSGIIDIEGKVFTLSTGLTVVGLPPVKGCELKEALRKAAPADVCLWHGAVREMCGYPTESAVSIVDLEEELRKYKLFLLGDIHVRNYMTTQFGTTWGYPGALEIVKRDDPLEHSIEVFDISTGSVAHKSVAVQSSEVLVFRAETEASMPVLLSKLKEFSETTGGLAFIAFSPRIENALSRMNSVIDRRKVVLRAAPLPVAGNMVLPKLGEVSSGVQDPSSFSGLPALSDYLRDAFSSDSVLLEACAQRVGSPGADIESALTDFADARLAELLGLP